MLKKSATIKRKLEEYRVAMNKVEAMGSAYAICPQCKVETELYGILLCEGCESVICDECADTDCEGVYLCRKCFKELCAATAAIKEAKDGK
jgi:hypothetical protein